MGVRGIYYGGIVLDGLVFHIDSAKQESYAKRGLRYMQNGNRNLFNAIYIGWVSRPVKPNIIISFGTANRTSASTSARNALIVANLWTITDGGI
jgi:hypothetical protein